MAFRLFGIGSKKNSNSSPSGATAAPSNPAPDNDDFMIVDQPVPQPVPDPAPTYPVGGAHAAPASTLPEYTRQSTIPSNYLEGVPFVLSSSATGNENLDGILARIDANERKVRGIDWSALDYDFTKEQSVVAQEMTATMRRVHLGP